MMPPLPSDPDASPLKRSEHTPSDRPIVEADLSAPREIVAHGGHALLYPRPTGTVGRCGSRRLGGSEARACTRRAGLAGRPRFHLGAGAADRRAALGYQNRRAGSVAHVYTAEWFELRRSGARHSAEAVIPHIVDLFEPRSAVDIGCGTGSWLAALRELGVEDIIGIDGDYVDRSQLEIPQDRFLAHDLRLPLKLGRSFDVAISVEVGEHLPAESADAFVDTLVRLAPVIIFSAAVPFQGGRGHLNEQWPDYWAARFEARGFTTIDCLRSCLWDDARVRPYYAQNLLLYVRSDVQARYPKLVRELDRGVALPLRVVPPGPLPRHCAALSATRPSEHAKPRVLRCARVAVRPPPRAKTQVVHHRVGHHRASSGRGVR